MTVEGKKKTRTAVVGEKRVDAPLGENSLHKYAGQFSAFKGESLKVNFYLK